MFRGAGRVLKPAAPGTGVIARTAQVRAVVEAVGRWCHIRTKALRSTNPCNVVHARGMAQLRTAEEVAAIRGKSVRGIL